MKPELFYGIIRIMGNTVGSLTQFQKSVIIGTILGDGYLRIIPKRKNAFLEINHSFNQKEYVDWKYSALKNISNSSPKARKGNGDRIAYRFYTKQLSELTDIYRSFYTNSKKVIPENIILNPTILAVWYMDDGSKCADNFYLNTQKFELRDQQILLLALKKMGLEAKTNRDKNYFRLRFLSFSVPKLKKIITEHIIPSMKYKIGL